MSDNSTVVNARFSNTKALEGGYKNPKAHIIYKSNFQMQDGGVQVDTSAGSFERSTLYFMLTLTLLPSITDQNLSVSVINM